VYKFHYAGVKNLYIAYGKSVEGVGSGGWLGGGVDRSQLSDFFQIKILKKGPPYQKIRWGKIFFEIC
jgi:hypothetical protein